MFAFGLLPPEVNSARMYDGPGSGPLLTAAAGWDALATELELLGSGYTTVTSALQGEIWSGPASTSMDAAVLPYATWASTAAHQAAHSAGQARSAAAAFETAFASTVPPPVVAANRTLLATLVATNYFAQNTAAIAATEAAYAEMWAQDAAAMYFYAESSSAAAVFEPFTIPPKTANSSGGSAQAAASSAATAAQTPLLETLAALSPPAASLETGSSAAIDSPVTSAAVLSTVGDFNTLVGPLTIAYQVPYTVFSGGSFFNGFVQSKVQSTDLSEIAAEDALKADLHASGKSAGPVAAAAGRAAPVGALSVPQNWTASAVAAPEPSEAPIVLPDNHFRALPHWENGNASPTPDRAIPSVGQIPSSGQRRTSSAVFRMRDRRYRIPRPALGG